MSNKTFILSLIILSLAFVIVMMIATPLIYSGFSHRLDYVRSTKKYYIKIPDINELPNKNEIKTKIDKLFGNLQYELYEVDFKNNTLGDSDIFRKNVRLDKDLSLCEYAFTLAHELVHIKYVTRSERFCEFQAFKMLYESDDDFLVNVAIRYANYSLAGKSLKEYDCSGYIEDYLIERCSEAHNFNTSLIIWLQNGLATEPRQKQC